MNVNNTNEIKYQEEREVITSLSSKIKNIEDKLSTIMLFKGCTMLNANVKLLLDSLIIKLGRS